MEKAAQSCRSPTQSLPPIQTSEKSIKSPEKKIRSPGGSLPRSLQSENPMLEAMSSRKRAEADLRTLENRITLLRHEESRAKCKATEIQIRAKKVLENRKETENSRQAQFSLALQREMEVKVTQDYAALKRDLLRTKILNSRKSIEDEKKILVAEKKIESKELDEKCNMARMQEDDEKRQRANNEKKRRETFRKKVVNEQKEKEKNLLANYELRIDIECRKKVNTESLIEKIAAEELELIARLQKSQKVQEEAFVALRNTLGS